MTSSKNTQEQATSTATAFFDKWSQTETFSPETLMQMNAISMKIWGEVAKENLQAMTDFMQNYAEQMQDLSHAKGPDDVMRAQARLASKNGPQLFQRSQRLLETLMESTTEYQKCLKKNKKCD